MDLVLRRTCVAAATALFCAFGPREAEAQFSDPCAAACALTLGATGVVAAAGTAVAVGRLTGGFSSTSDAVLAGGAGFAAVVGAGIALQSDGERQERAVYGAAIGTATGALLGLAFASLGESEGVAGRLAGTLAGAAAGAIVGGVFGAMSHGGGGAYPVGIILDF